MRPVCERKLPITARTKQSPNNTITETNSPLDSAWVEARELFALAAKPQPDVGAIWQAQGEVTQLLLDQIAKAGCALSGFGGETAVYFKNPKNPPVRELLLLVAVNACSPGTIDLALGLAKAMLDSHQIVGDAAWQSAEGREAVRALDEMRVQMHVDRHNSPGNRSFEKIVPEVASAIVTLIERAKLVSPAGQDTEEMKSRLGYASSGIEMGTNHALRDAANFFAEGNEYEATKLLEWAAKLRSTPNFVTADLLESALVYDSQKLLEVLYQRDKEAYTKSVLACMEKSVVDLKLVEKKAREVEPFSIAAQVKIAQSFRDDYKTQTGRLIGVCAADPDFPALISQLPKFIELYTELTGSAFPI